MALRKKKKEKHKKPKPIFVPPATQLITLFPMAEKETIQMFFIHSAKDNTNRQWFCSKTFKVQRQKSKKATYREKIKKYGLSSEKNQKMKQYKTPLGCKILSSDHSG